MYIFYNLELQIRGVLHWTDRREFEKLKTGPLTEDDKFTTANEESHRFIKIRNVFRIHREK